MKTFYKILIALGLLFPLTSFAVTATWQTPTTTAGYVVPNLINGTNQTILLPTITGTIQCLHANSSGVVTGTGVDCGSGGGGGGSAATPYGGLQFSVPSGTSSAFSASSNMVYSTTTGVLSIVNSSTTNATTTNFFANALSLGASAISYIQSLFSATTPIVDTTGVISCPTCVTNQYASSTFPTFTYASSTYYLASNPNGYTSNAGTVTSITATSPLTGGTISTSGSIGCQTASGSQAGCLASADWTTFNNKLSNLLGGLNAILGNSTTTNATTTSLAITGLSNTILAVNANGTVIATTTSSGTNYFSNSGATTTLTTGSVLQATTASTSILCLGGTCQSSFSGGSQTPWTSNINGGGYNLTNVGIASSTYFSAHSQGSNVTPSYYFDSDSTTGLGGSTGNVWIDIAGVKKAQWNSTQFLTVNDIVGGSQTANTIDIQNTASSASTPTYSFYGAGNNSTGMYSSGTGNLNFSVSGTEKARFTTTGLGIGTTTPATALSVIGTTTTQGLNISNLSNTVLAVDGLGNVIATTTPTSGGTPGGSNQQLQFNNNSVFGGTPTGSFNPVTGYWNFGATTTPSALVTINASTTLASTTNAFVIASSSNNVVAIDANGDQTNGLSTASTTFSIDPLGHPMYGGPVPTCTTGCTMTGGSDALMRVITGSSISSVTITFANKWVNATGVGISPSCVADDESGVTTGVEASTTPTTVVLSLPTALTSKNISVFCAGSYSYTQ